MLQAIVSAAKAADLGIQDIRFELDNQVIDLDDLEKYPSQIRGMVQALNMLRASLRQNENEAEIQLSAGKLKSTTIHSGIDRNGNSASYNLTLSDESDGTRRLMALAPAIEKTLSNGGLFVVDELEREMHLILIEHVINRYQQKTNNVSGAQIIFTTHQTALLNQETLRRDQIYFVDKDPEDGASSLYSLADFNVRNDMNIQKAYLLGKFGAIPSIEVS